MKPSTGKAKTQANRVSTCRSLSDRNGMRSRWGRADGSFPPLLSLLLLAAAVVMSAVLAIFAPPALLAKGQPRQINDQADPKGGQTFNSHELSQPKWNSYTHSSASHTV